MLRKSTFAGSVLAVLMMTLFAGSASTQEAIGFDNLVPVENPRVQFAFIDPDVDFSVYKRVMILEPYVSFRADWQRRMRASGQRVSAREMQRIREAAGELLLDTFIESLEADNGFEVVGEPDYDVLLLRPALLDLDVTAPDTRTGRSRSFSASAGAATLYLELFDSVTGQIVGRAADRRVASRPGHMMTWSNSVTNRSEARRMFRQWTDRLREFLDEHYRGAGDK